MTPGRPGASALDPFACRPAARPGRQHRRHASPGEAMPAVSTPSGRCSTLPGVFVPGTNDYYAPQPKNPRATSAGRARPTPAPSPTCPGRSWAACSPRPAGPTSQPRAHRLAVGGPTSRWPASTTRTCAGTATTGRRAGRPRRRTCGSASCTRPSPRVLDRSPPTATTSCSPGTPTAASSACRATARWSPTAASTAAAGQRPACTRGAPTSGSRGCTSPPASAPPVLARPVRLPPEATLLTPRAASAEPVRRPPVVSR